MEISSRSFELESSVKNADSIAQELNDIKAIMLAISLKLSPEARKQLITELSEADSKPITQWVNALKNISKD